MITSKVFATTAQGYGQELRWAKDTSTDDSRACSIESTGRCGAGLAAAPNAKGEFVIEFVTRARDRRRTVQSRTALTTSAPHARSLAARPGDASSARCPGGAAHAHHRP